MSEQPKTPRRGWFRCSLSTLLVVVILCGIWFERASRPTRRQLAAVARIRGHGGFVEYAPPPAYVPAWMVQVGGVDLFCDAKKVTLHGTGMSDLKPLADLPGLEQLAISEREVKDLAPLADLKQLKILTIDQTPIHDLSPLVALPELQDLSVTGTSVSTDHFKDIEKQLPARIAVMFWPAGFCPR